MPETPADLVATVAAEKYVSLTTFTKAGAPKPTPVWIVDLGDGMIGFTTEAGSWKTKRIANTPNVTLQPCDMRGNVADGAPTWEATAALDPDRADEVRAKISAKYGVVAKLMSLPSVVKGWFGKGPTEPTAVILTPRSS
ncbi:MAG: PPOX class F420-dependent oxidoreductase [Actinomycetota bacterium]